MRDELHFELGGTKEDPVQFGRVDLALEERIIEVKEVKQWKQGIGQLAVYGLEKKNVGKKKCLHLFGFVNNFKRQFIVNRCVELGIEVEFVAEMKQELPTEEILKLKQKQQYEKWQHIFEAPLITRDEYEKLLFTKKQQRADVAKIQKFKIVETYGVTNPSFNFITTWGKQKHMDAFIALNKYCCGLNEIEIPATKVEHQIKEIIEIMSLMKIELWKDFCLIGLSMTEEMKQFVESKKEVWPKWFRCMNKWRAEKTMKQIDLVNMLVRMLNKLMPPLLRKVNPNNGDPKSREVNRKKKILHYFKWNKPEDIVIEQ